MNPKLREETPGSLAGTYLSGTGTRIVVTYGDEGYRCEAGGGSGNWPSSVALEAYLDTIGATKTNA